MRNCTSTVIRPNDEEEKRTRAKIPTGAPPEGLGNLLTRARAKKIDHLEIGRNRTSTPIGQNDKYWKRSRAKIVTGALSGEPRN